MQQPQQQQPSKRTSPDVQSMQANVIRQILQSKAHQNFNSSPETKDMSYLDYLAQDKVMFKELGVADVEEDMNDLPVLFKRQKRLSGEKSNTRKMYSLNKEAIFAHVNFENCDYEDYEIQSIYEFIMASPNSALVWDQIEDTEQGKTFATKSCVVRFTFLYLFSERQAMFKSRWYFCLFSAYVTFFLLIFFLVTLIHHLTFGETRTKYTKSLIHHEHLDYIKGSKYYVEIERSVSKLPFPFSPRDFVTATTVLFDSNKQQYFVVRKSVLHPFAPVYKGFVRAMMVSGYVVDNISPSKCNLYHASYIDCGGYIPPQIFSVNLTSKISSLSKEIQDALDNEPGYEMYKTSNTVMDTLLDNQTKLRQGSKSIYG